METMAGSLIGAAREAAKRQYRQRGAFYHLARCAIEPKYAALGAFSAIQYAKAALTGSRLVHFIGDSHTAAFEFQDGFIVHHIGQATAHNLAKEQSSSDSRKLFFKVLSSIDGKRDLVVTVFGEIDSRIHFYYQFKKNEGKMPIEKLMENTISNYFSVLKEARGKGYNVAVLGIPPASGQENLYKYPFYGDAGERSRINAKFNSLLEAACRENGFPFIDVYSASADENGFIKKEFARDEVHLNSRIAPIVRAQVEKIKEKEAA